MYGAEELASLSEGLIVSAKPIGHHDLDRTPGLYGIITPSRACLPGLQIPANGVLYIGKTKNLAERFAETHFSDVNTGFSTLRRSLGALLRESLSLAPLPRSPGSKKSFYKFEPTGEARLSRWMTDNLLVGCVPYLGSIDKMEALLIAHLQPALCLTGWKNPQAAYVKRLRQDCCLLAHG